MTGGRAYAEGDRVVVLAPNHSAGLVTSERLTVVAARPSVVVAATDDGRRVMLTGEETDATHLDHAYAITVHRSQGSTYDRAHVVAAGGGRELAYVACSRARDTTTIHTTADDLDQAAELLAEDWEASRAQVWLTMQRLHPGRDPYGQTASAPDSVGRPAQAPERTAGHGLGR
jgi:ATP-dependent exoDNAse (exonuclease V) alpha subunit